MEQNKKETDARTENREQAQDKGKKEFPVNEETLKIYASEGPGPAEHDTLEIIARQKREEHEKKK